MRPIEDFIYSTLSILWFIFVFVLIFGIVPIIIYAFLGLYVS